MGARKQGTMMYSTQVSGQKLREELGQSESRWAYEGHPRTDSQQNPTLPIHSPLKPPTSI